jgi:hypothetical protein
MSDDPATELRKARAQLVERRREYAATLAGDYAGGSTEGAREKFVETQAAIEAVDRALKDEEEAARQSS